MVARMAGLKGALAGRARSAAAVAPRRRPETQSMPQGTEQVIQLVEKLRDFFHRRRDQGLERRLPPGGGSGNSSPFSLRQAVRTLSAQDL